MLQTTCTKTRHKLFNNFNKIESEWLNISRKMYGLNKNVKPTNNISIAKLVLSYAEMSHFVPQLHGITLFKQSSGNQMLLNLLQNLVFSELIFHLVQ